MRSVLYMGTLAAISALGNVDLQLRAPALLPMLDDPVRAVRLEAARVLAPVPR